MQTAALDFLPLTSSNQEKVLYEVPSVSGWNVQRDSFITFIAKRGTFDEGGKLFKAKGSFYLNIVVLLHDDNSWETKGI